MINLTIDGRFFSVPEGTSILTAARENGIAIPTLCYLKDVSHDGLCRMCVVEVKGAKRLMPACTTLAAEGMEVETDSEIVRESRKRTLDLICRNHRMDCEYCQRYTDCNLHELVREMGLDDRIYGMIRHKKEEDASSPCIIRDTSKCVLCRRCEAVCAKQGIYALGALHRGAQTRMGAAAPMPETGCVECGACLAACPTGALSVVDESKKFWNALRISGKHVITVIDPLIFDSFGRSMHCNEDAGGKLAALLRQFGVKKVFSLEPFRSAADCGGPSEKGGARLVISAKCPSAVKFIETRYPEYMPFLSGRPLVETAAKSCKDSYAQTLGLDREEVFCVAVTPCVSAKAHIGKDADLVLTPIELSKVMEMACVSRYTKLKVWRETKGVPLDGLAGTAALRRPSADEITMVSGLDHIKEYLDRAGGADSLSGYIEFFACEGGCANGGGQLHGRSCAC